LHEILPSREEEGERLSVRQLIALREHAPAAGGRPSLVIRQASALREHAPAVGVLRTPA
jgi:hypothetical protein